MTTQPPPPTTMTMTSYGQAPTSLPTPSYDDPSQTGTDPSYKPLPSGVQDAYKGNKDPGYDSSSRPLPSNQDVSLYKPTKKGSDPSYKPLPSGGQDTSYNPPPPSQEQSYKPNDQAYDSSYRPLPSNQDSSYNPPPPSQQQSYNPNDPAYDPYRPRPSNQDAQLYNTSHSGPDPSYRPAPTSNNMAYHTLADPQAFDPYGRPSYLANVPNSGPGPSANINSSTNPSYPPPPNALHQGPEHPPLTEQMAGPAAAMATATSHPLSLTAKEVGIKHTRSSTEFALREYMSMQRRRQSKTEAGIDERLRNQASTVLGDLHNLKQEVADLLKNAESHRWRRFLIGGTIASFIPIVKKLFPRPHREPETANNTEYAFRKSKSLISRILDATRRPGIATVAFFVFAVLYVFQNEVSLQVARTVTKRLKKLTSKVEAGEDVGEEDLKLLQGWRWRVLVWSE